MLANPERFTIQYYFFIDGALYRLSDRLHQNLLRGKTSLLQFAGGPQKLIELIIPHGIGQTPIARGIIYVFDKDGFLDIRSMTRDAMPSASRYLHNKTVTDLTPTITKQRFRSNSTWQPSKAVLERLIVRSEQAGFKKPTQIRMFRAAKQP